MGNHTDPIHTADVVERFFAKVAERDESGCRLWLASRDRYGYGQFSVGGRLRKAHAISLEIATGEAADGRMALHACDVRDCVAPDHLRWGNNSENMRDRDSRGRNGFARRTHCPKGHAYDGHNLYVGPAGSRQCRECHRLRERERYVRLRAQTALDAAHGRPS